MNSLKTILITIALTTLVLSSGIRAQLALDWSLDLTHLQGQFGQTGISSNLVKNDSEGNVYICYYDFGIGLMKIRPDKSIAYDVVYPCSEGAWGIFIGPSGEVYVLGAEKQGYDPIDHITIIRFDPNGVFSWSYDWGNPRVYAVTVPGVDHAGNFWLGTMGFVYDAPCIDSVGRLELIKGTASGASVVHTYRGNYLNGGTYPYGDKIVANASGNLSLILSESGICYAPDCDPYEVPFCFVDNYGDSTINWNQKSLQTYNSAGSPGVKKVLYASDNPSDKEDTQIYLFGDKQGEVITIKTYRPDTLQWVWQSKVAYNGWEVILPNRFYDALADFNNDIYIITETVDDSKNTMISVPTLYKLNNSNGSVVWSQPWWSHLLAVDLDNNLYTSPGKIDLNGNVQWSWPNLGYDGSIATFVGIDNENNHYHFDSNDKILYKFIEELKPEIKDANGDPLANTELDFIRVENNPPIFTEDTLGTITTDNNGVITFTAAVDTDWEITLFDSSVGLNSGDLIKLSKQLHTESAPRHLVTLPTMYSVHLDNGKIDDNGTISFYDLGNDEKAIILDHTELRFNLVASIEWDAEQEYHYGLQADFRAMSNYIYDVTDGQVRLDTVRIFDNKRFWDVADVQIRATNMHNPDALPNGIYDIDAYPINMPRKWYDGPAGNRDSTLDNHPLGEAVPNSYRTIGHEFGHFALGFLDEYQFVDKEGNDLGAGARCTLRPAGNYGMMDRQYQDYAGGVHASELSSQYRYTDPNCRNTKQYIFNFMSCWDYFENRYENTYASIYAPILKPDLSDESERLTPAGYDYFPGPNDNLVLPDYDVGSKVIFAETVVAPASLVGSYCIMVPAASAGGVNVKLDIDDGTGTHYRTIDQGNTTNFGLLWVLGANPLYDVITASGHVWSYTKKDNVLSLADVDRQWYFARSSISSGENDTTVIDLQPVQGYFPLIFSGAVDSMGCDFKINYSQPFLSLPDIELISEQDSIYSYSMADESSRYSAKITDLTGASGFVRMNAQDDGSNQFSVDAGYVVSSDTTGKLDKVIGPLGQAAVNLDSLNGGVQKVMILSSPYPIIRTGLDSNDVQAGQTQSLSVYPQSDLVGVNNITITYAETDLKISENLSGDESYLRIYKWNDTSLEWSLLGGNVDTLENTVTSAITSTGVYAAFTKQIITEVENDQNGAVLPYRFDLSQNYPNPFNPVTTIEYSLPQQSHVTIEIYNVLGQKVRTLVDREESAGTYTITWDGTATTGRPAATGVYLYRFQADKHVETKKMLLIK